MRHVIASLLSILLLSACTTTNTNTVVDVQPILSAPANVLMTPCIVPFNTRPNTYGEAVERDQVWYNNFAQCAKKMAGIRTFYQHQQK